MALANSMKIKNDQERWINRVRKRLNMVEEIDKEKEREISICVYSVPNELLVQKPEAYVPRAVSIGPYHHGNPKLYEMERYKLAAARRFERKIPGKKFESVVEEFTNLGSQIRNCYHKYLDYDEAALAWLMALDASFLLQCLLFYVQQCHPNTSEDSLHVEKLGKVLDPTGRSASHNETLRDLMMLENQIPLFLLCKLLEIQLGSQIEAEQMFPKLVRLACIEFLPFKFKLSDNSRFSVMERGHILEVLYYIIVPIKNDLNSEEEELLPFQDTTSTAKGYILQLHSGVFQRLSALPRTLMKLPQRILSTLGNMPVIRGPLTALFGSSTDAQKADEDEESNGEPIVKPETPTREELTIPSAVKMHSAGIKFVPTDGDLNTIRFDKTTATLYLPQLKLDSNTVVTLRNLVAFEAAAAPGAFFITRYTDFMNDIIDNEEDVRLLRSNGIIHSHLESNRKVASLWRGMGKGVKLFKLPHLDEVMAGVNTYYNSRWTVVKTYVLASLWQVISSWKVLSVFSAVMLLVMTGLQTFCTVYTCHR